MIDLSSVPCLSAHRYCGKTAEWIQMPFGVVSGVGLGMGVLDFGGDRRRGRSSLGVNLWRPTVTNGDFVESLCITIKLSFGVVSGVGPGIHVLDESPRASRGRGCFWHGFRQFSEFNPIVLNGSKYTYY